MWRVARKYIFLITLELYLDTCDIISTYIIAMFKYIHKHIIILLVMVGTNGKILKLLTRFNYYYSFSGSTLLTINNGYKEMRKTE